MLDVAARLMAEEEGDLGSEPVTKVEILISNVKTAVLDSSAQKVPRERCLVPAIHQKNEGYVSMGFGDSTNSTWPLRTACARITSEKSSTAPSIKV